MKMNLLKGYILAQIIENGKILWYASYLHHGKYPVIMYTDPYSHLVVKYNNDIEAGDDMVSRMKVLSKTHHIQLTSEGKKYACDYYKLKFG